MNSNTNPEKRYVAAYGSLRKDEYNYDRLQIYFKDGLKYLFTTELGGYLLYDLGSYPGIIESADATKTIVIDILECSNEAFHNINIMELGANYNAKVVNIKGVDCTIYIYKGKVHTKSLVKDGDWTKHLTLKADTEAIFN